MKNKQLAINMIANIISFAINIGISLFLTPYIINSVGAEAYGFIPLANNFVSYVSIFTTALNSMASRYISIEINSNNIEQANIYFNSVLISNIIIAIILIIPSMFITINIEGILNVPSEIVKDVQLTFGFVFINMIISLIGNVFSIATFSKNRLDLSSMKSIEANIIRVIFIVILFIVLKPKIYFITITVTIVTIYTLLANVKFTKELLPNIKINIRNFEMSSVKRLISSGVWNSVNQLSSVLLNSIDLMIANILISASASGEYAIVKTIPNFIQSFAGMAAAVFTPQFIILYAKKQNKDLLKNIINSIKIMSIFITLPIGFLIVFGDVFYSLWVPGENIQKLQFLSVITITPMIITGSIQTLFNVYTVTSKLKMPSIMLLLFGIANTLLVTILLKQTDLGIFAISITSSLLLVLRNMTFTPIYAAKCLNLKWNEFYISIFKGILCCLVMLIVCILFRKIILIDNWIKLISVAIISSIITLYINLYIMYNRDERKEIIGICYKKINFKSRGISYER